MLDEKTTQSLRAMLVESSHPLFLFHDDPDGATSFMQLLKYRGEGKGVIIKTGPRITADLVRRVSEFNADRVFILDIALVDKEFLEAASVPVVWLDHHGLQESFGSTYINPRAWGQTTPPCYMSYQITEKKFPWLAMVGCVGDWHLPPPDLMTSFRARYPSILDRELHLPEDFMFKSKIGTLVQMLSFNLKGKSHDALTAIKIFSRLEGPEELLEEKTSQARFLIRRFRKLKQLYESLKIDAVQTLKRQTDLVRVYTTIKDKFAVSKDLSNELSFLFPKNVVVVAREKSGEMKISIRSGRQGPVIDKVVERALVGIDGHGGGHERACGSNVKKEDFGQFVENLKVELRKN